MEDSGTIKIPLMRCLTAQEASRNEYGCRTYATTEVLYIRTTSLQTNTNTYVGTIMENSGTIELSLM